MSLYENWINIAYDQNGATIKKTWDVYLELEQKIYEGILKEKNTKITGKLSELAKKFGMTPEYFCGFLDGISGGIESGIDEESVKELDEESQIDITVNFEKLYKKMVEYKAEHLYQLPEWENIFSPQELEVFYKEQKESRTVVRQEEKIGRNDPCPCKSGKKYKKCCGA